MTSPGFTIPLPLPLLALGAAALGILLASAAGRGRAPSLSLAWLGLAASLAALPAEAASPTEPGLFSFAGPAGLFCQLVLAAGAGALLVPRGRWGQPGRGREEFCVLVLAAEAGALCLVAATHFFSLFLGLEILSVALYALAGFPRRDDSALEGAVKYLVLGAFSAGFLVLGMALAYARTGSLALASLAGGGSAAPPDPILLGGTALVLVGIAFKAGVAPFHQWTPDLFQGAPYPAGALLATASKGAAFALLFRLAQDGGGAGLSPLLPAVAAASMVAGTLLALGQGRVTRLLGCSSIAHLGFLLALLSAPGSEGGWVAGFYLAAYFPATLGVFAVLALLSPEKETGDLLPSLEGLSRRRPFLAGALSFFLLSLAGIPLTGGFLSKVFLVSALLGSSRWVLVGFVLGSSVIGLFAYLRVVLALYRDPGPAAAPGSSRAQRLPAGGVLAVALSAALTLWLGVYPGPFLAFLHSLPPR